MTAMSDFDQWLAAPREDEHLEFKEARHDYDSNKLLKYCVALANEGGGRLILGVSDKVPRSVVGTEAFADIQDISSRIHQKLRIRVDVEELLHPDGRVVIFHVPARPLGTAYAVDGAYYMRSTHELVPMSEDQLRKIFNEGKPEWSQRIARAGLSATEAISLLDTQSYFDLLRMPQPSSQDGVLERFEKEGLFAHSSEGWAITNLGAVLFAKDLDDFDSLRFKAPRVIAYDGISKLSTRSDRRIARGYAAGFREIIDLVHAQLPSNEVIEKAFRREVQMYPSLAIRELVANALIHQDFEETGARVSVEIYSDRVEITNPGKPNVEPDRFIDEYRSRNERIADLMRRLGICEEKGSGIDKVIDAVEVYQLPPPDFRELPSRTAAILFAHKEFAAMGSVERVRACYQHCCLRYVTNQRMTNASLRERFNLPETKADAVSRVIRDAVEAGRVKLEKSESNSKKFARYVPFWA